MYCCSGVPIGHVTRGNFSCNLRRNDNEWKTLQVALDMLRTATCLATLRKVEDSFTFLATCNAAFCCTASCEKWTMLHEYLFSQLAMQRLLRCKLQEKLPRVTWPYVLYARMRLDTGCGRLLLWTSELLTLSEVKLLYSTKGRKTTIGSSYRPIRFNLRHPQPSLFLFALESPLRCFSSLANHYF